MRKLSRWWVMIFGLIAAVVAGALLTRHQPPQARMNDVLGAWTTNNAEYSGRRFEIHKNLIVVAFSDDSVYTESIKGVEAQPHKGRITFTINTISYGTTYQAQEEHPAQWRFDYDPAQGGSIRFEHQPGVVWTRASQKQ